MPGPSDIGYEVARPTRVCAASGAAINTGDRYIAALVQRAGEEGFARLDYSLAAWEGGARPRAPMSLVGYWRAQMPAADARRSPLIDDDGLVDLFEQLGEATEPGRVTFRYILALILVRKRMLKYEGTGAGGMVVRWFRRADQEPAPTMHVTDPGMSEQAVAEAIEQLGQVIEAPGP